MTQSDLLAKSYDGPLHIVLISHQFFSTKIFF